MVAQQQIEPNPIEFCSIKSIAKYHGMLYIF